MARLIDADALKFVPMFNEDYDTKHANEHFIFGIKTVMEYIENITTVDPVHAAGACYCRECTCWNRHDDILPDCRFPDWGYCSKMLDSDSEIEITTLENDFCSRGQRLEED